MIVICGVFFPIKTIADEIEVKTQPPQASVSEKPAPAGEKSDGRETPKLDERKPADLAAPSHTDAAASVRMDTPSASVHATPALDARSTASQPLQGGVIKNTLGIRSLPEGREPDYLVGHFAIGLPFMKIAVNKPPGPTALLASKFLKKWNGKQVSPCLIKMTKLPDESGGFYFVTIGSHEGPHGWLMPMEKRPEDKVIPWGIFFDQ